MANLRKLTKCTIYRYYILTIKSVAQIKQAEKSPVLKNEAIDY
jgi:hypothetical protein